MWFDFAASFAKRFAKSGVGIGIIKNNRCHLTLGFCFEFSVSISEPITVELSPTATGSVVESLLETAARQLLLAGNWEALGWICSHPLTPEPLLLELASFPELHGPLGHRREPLSFVEYMADHHGYSEAILMLVLGEYRNEQVGLDEFRDCLQKYEQTAGTLESIIYRLDDHNPKNNIVDEACLRHPDAERLRDVKERLRTIDRAKICESVDEIRILYHAGDPKVWVSLASNPRTPVELLQEFVHVTKSPHASRIRHEAMVNLKARS